MPVEKEKKVARGGNQAVSQHLQSAAAETEGLSATAPDNLKTLIRELLKLPRYWHPINNGVGTFPVVALADVTRVLDSYQEAATEEHPGWRAVAERIAEELFVNGSGQEAHRLVLTSLAGRDLGGWGKSAIIDRIAGVLESVPCP